MNEPTVTEVKPDGIALIAKERQEQLTKHGRSIKNDVEKNIYNQLPNAAAHLINNGEIKNFDEADMEMCPVFWNQEIYKKMLLKPYKERLIIAGALIAAELDRIQLIETKNTI